LVPFINTVHRPVEHRLHAMACLVLSTHINLADLRGQWTTGHELVGARRNHTQARFP
jgi:hypothetical protein